MRRTPPYLGYRIPRDSTHNRAPPGSPTCVIVVTFCSPIVSRSKVSRPDKTAATLSWLSYPRRFNTQSCSIGVAQMCNNRHCQLPRNVTHWGIESWQEGAHRAWVIVSTDIQHTCVLLSRGSYIQGSICSCLGIAGGGVLKTPMRWPMPKHSLGTKES